MHDKIPPINVHMSFLPPNHHCQSIELNNCMNGNTAWTMIQLPSVTSRFKNRYINKALTQLDKYLWKKGWPAKCDNKSSAVSCGILLTSDKECTEASGDKCSWRNAGRDDVVNGCGLWDFTDGCDSLLGAWINDDSFSSALVSETSLSNDAALFIKQNTTSMLPPTLAILCNYHFAPG